MAKIRWIVEDGGADRNRTCDLLIANETLYQLSYDPIPPVRSGLTRVQDRDKFNAYLLSNKKELAQAQRTGRSDDERISLFGQATSLAMEG